MLYLVCLKKMYEAYFRKNLHTDSLSKIKKKTKKKESLELPHAINRKIQTVHGYLDTSNITLNIIFLLLYRKKNDEIRCICTYFYFFKQKTLKANSMYLQPI